MKTTDDMLQEIYSNAHASFDLTNNAQQEHLLEMANALCSLNTISTAKLKNMATQEACPLEFKLAVKLVESRRYTLSITKPITVGVVFAMWGEHHRLLPKSTVNVNGEDSLRTKIRQLNWVTQGTMVQWRLYPVDDGCPHNSYGIAVDIMASDPNKQRVIPLKLSDAIPTNSGPLKGLKHVDDSRKGGGIIHGCQQAMQDGMHCVVYTDADNSVHLGQLGLLLQPYIKHKAPIVLGNRKHEESILVKQEERWGIGIKTLRHMQRMIGQDIFSKGIKDTQAAFKLYSSEVLAKIIATPTVYDFSFDTDWILAAMELNQQIVTVPFAFIDSAAESASIVQGPMTTWYILLGGLVKSVRARHAHHSQEMAMIFDREIHSHKDLELIIDQLPPELMDASDSELGDPKLMSPEQIGNWLLSAKSSAIPHH